MAECTMAECRICMENDNNIDIISPCRCKGTAGFVHEECLQKWRRECLNDPDKYNKCEICHEEYIITRIIPLENFFFCNRFETICAYIICTGVIWLTSVIILFIDMVTDYQSIQFLGLTKISGNIKNILERDPWSLVSYYQSLGTFICSISLFIIIKLCTLYRLRRKQRYYKLMIFHDISYIIGSLPYPILIFISQDLQMIELLCSIGSFTMIINIPIIVNYFKNHNKVLTNLNMKNGNEKIMNITYNPISINSISTNISPNDSILEMT